MRRVAIEGWTIGPIGDPAPIPGPLRGATLALGSHGTAHDALRRAGHFRGFDAPGGEEEQEWVGSADWRCAAWFRLAPETFREERIDLVCERLDTIAEVRLNGVRLATGASEFVPLRASARSLLRRGWNEIDVRFRGPLAAIATLERRLGARPVNGDWTPYPFLRKCASNLGWDWGPRAATVGIGAARIEAWSGGRIAGVRPLVVACSEHEASVRVVCEVERTDDARLLLEASLAAPDGRTFAGCAEVDAEGRAAIELVVPAPLRWWPRGFGDQALHALETTLRREGCAIDARALRVGLRSVRLRTEPDAIGTSFAIEVNDRPVWCRGANLVPRSPTPGGAIETPIDLVGLAAEAGCTMLRVWGGGGYEERDLYDRCDELGILVWQDFAFACATYPEESPYPELVEAEARHQIERLSPHPSVVLWCGGNEDFLAWWSWGFRERLRPGQSWGERYWFDLLPRLVAELDPTRPYWPESPYSGARDRHPNDPDHGDRHTWDARFEAYRTIVPRFASEFGHQSPPTRSTLREILPPTELRVGSEELARRQRAWGGDAFQYDPHLLERFGELERFEDRIDAAHLLQARAYEIAFLWLRANAPRSMGALVWQWNDVWAGHSWSVLDVRGRRKPSWFALRNACAPRALAILPALGDEPMSIVLCRAAGEAGAEGPLEARVRLVDGHGRVERDELVRLVERSPWIAAAPIAPELAAPREPEGRLLVVDAGALRTVHAFTVDRASPRSAIEATIAVEPDPAAPEARSIATIVAGTLLRDCCLGPAPEHAPWDLERDAEDGFRTLLPGESWRVPIAAPCRDASTRGWTLRAANAIGRES